MNDAVDTNRRSRASRLAKLWHAIVLLTVLTFPAFAQATPSQTTVAPDGPIIGGTYRLASGQTILGELTSIGADVTLAEGSRVAGRVNVVGGTLDHRGQVDGVVHVYFGELTLADTATVEGSVHADWARVERAPGAVVTNAYEVGGAPAIRFELPAGIESTVHAAARVASPGSTWGMILRALGLALVTVIAAALMPRRLARIAAEAFDRPLRAGVYGLTLAIASAVAIVVFVLTLVGIPVALAIGALVWLGAWIGIAAMAQRVGRWLERPTGDASPSLGYAALGGFVVGLLLGSLEWLPVLGGLAEAVVGLVALGALAASRIGSSPSRRSPNRSTPVGSAG